MSFLTDPTGTFWYPKTNWRERPTVRTAAQWLSAEEMNQVRSALLDIRESINESPVTLTGMSYIYVDSVSGSDSNSGEIVSPVMSFDRAWSLAGSITNGVIIIFASGTYILSHSGSNSNRNTYALNHQWGSNSKGILLSGGFEVLYTGTIASSSLYGSSVGMISDPVVTGAFTVDSLVGKCVRMTTGSLSGYASMIWSNGVSGNLELLRPFNSSIGVPVSGNTYEIIQPNVTFVFSGSTSFRGNQGQMLSTRGIKWQGAAGTSPTLNFGGMVFSPQANEFYTGGGTLFFNGCMYAPQFASTTNTPMLDPMFERVNMFVSGGTFQMSGFSLFAGSPVFKSVTFTVLNSAIEMGEFHLTGSVVQLYRGSSFHCTPSYNVTDHYPRIWNSTSNAITLESIATTNLRKIDIRNSAGHAIYASYNSNVSLTDITGSGNTGAGIYIGPGCLVNIVSGVQISGTQGEIKTVGGYVSTCAAVVTNKVPVLDVDNSAFCTVGSITSGSGPYARMSSSYSYLSAALTPSVPVSGGLPYLILTSGSAKWQLTVDSSGGLVTTQIV
jgi:hypothetical protein